MLENGIQATAPGKVILSGEHSVVYGAPALVMAINNFSNATATISHPKSNSSALDLKKFSFDLLDLTYQENFTLLELESLQLQIINRYQSFLHKNIKISEVLQHHWELALYTVACFLTSFKTMETIDTRQRFSLTLQSNIPYGNGMGSSAAIIVSILYALKTLFKLKIDNKTMLNMAREVENLQHGHSSGLDLLAAQSGGCVLFENGIINARKIPQIPMSFIQTGLPKTTTGECVMHAAKHFADGLITKDFAAITRELDTALQAADLTQIKYCIRENHRLQQHIGVVPEKVQTFVKHVTKQGAAAKICGAGACQGDNAGILLLVGSEEINYNCIDSYGYHYLPLKGEHDGVKIL